MSEAEQANELARLRDLLVDLERRTVQGQSGERADERETARLRARIAQLEADLGLA